MIGVVIPSNRPEQFLTFIKAWGPLFEKHNVRLYLIEDNLESTIRGYEQYSFETLHLTRREALEYIPTATGAIRSLGFEQAYRDGVEWVLTLDDDCLPVDDPIQAYIDGFAETRPVSPYFDIGHTFGLGEYMRGFPLTHRDQACPALIYGGWDNVPDFDAFLQLEKEKAGSAVSGYAFARTEVTLPLGSAFTGCIMNVGIHRDALPAMYQMMMGNARVGFDRSDDIWSGLFVKLISDHLGLPIVISGKAKVIHTRASDTTNNLRKELLSYGYNEQLWQRLGQVVLTGETFLECYESLVSQLQPTWFGPKGDVIINGMNKWITSLKEA